LVAIDYHSTDGVFTPADFPPVEVAMPGIGRGAISHECRQRSPASGDVHTFRVCCRLVRGFALDDDEALDVLADWNGLCRPPWTERERRDKI
jgi:hypothetical protein